MAGNPFRKSQFLSLDVGAAREAAAELQFDSSQPSTTTTATATSQAKTKGKVQKKVRILSPVVSPDTPATYQDNDPFNTALNPVGQPASPPPPADRELDVAREMRESFIDSVARGASSLNKETIGPVPAPVPAPATMEQPARPAHQAPYNPFAKTLATIEPQRAPGPNGSSPPVGLSQNDAAPASKPGMDVDAFTRMLLTGNPGSASPAPATRSASSATAENSSLGDLHPESPPASDDELHDEHVDHDYEQSGLVTPPEPQAKKPKPPPPAHHHGKALSRKGPQTVSFADFDSPGPSSPALSTPASPKPNLVRSPSDLNKPLPPPPPQQSPSPDPNASVSGEADDSMQSPQLPADGFQLQVKKPPPPPLSRRSSQIRSGRPRSASNLSKSSIPEDHAETSTPPSTKPPPPPARRVPQTIAIDRAPEADAQIPVSNSNSRAPPPPPSRNTKQRPPSVSRTPSTQSVTSTDQRRISPGTIQMPPPPPPRRGEAKRQSLDGTLLGPASTGSRRMSDTSRRSSGASFHSGGGRTPSVSSIPTVDEADSGDDRASNATPQPPSETRTQTTSGTDILADMSAMQREIDALMAKSKGGA